MRGKTIGMADLGNPNRFLYSSVLQKHGIDPNTEVNWRQYPADVFVVAVQKGEIDAFVDNDPNAYFAVKRSNGKLFVLAANGEGDLADRACCMMVICNSLIRDNKPAAAALTRAIIEASQFVNTHLDLAIERAKLDAPNRASAQELGEMLRNYPYDDRAVVWGGALRRQMVSYAEDLRSVGILKASTDPQKFARRVTADVLS